MDFECVIDADLFRRAWVGVSRDPCRYYLNGVSVSLCPEGGAVMCGTDGHMMVVVRDAEAVVTGSDIVRLEPPLLRMLAAGRGSLLDRRLLVVRRESGRAQAFIVDVPRGKPAANAEEGLNPYQLAADAARDPDARVKAAQFAGATIDGTFPDWRRVLPEELDPTAPTGSFDQALIARAAEALRSGLEKTARLTITPSKRDPKASPHLVRNAAQTEVEAFAILMPLRAEPKAAVMPTWVRAAPIAEAA